MFSNNNKRRCLFKKSHFAFLDMLKTKKAIINRINNVNQTALKPINNQYNVNKLVTLLHPLLIDVYVDQIIQENDHTKTFRLRPVDNQLQLPFFRAGQYICIYTNFNGVVIGRCYSLAVSPQTCLKSNYYEITIKHNPNGFISDYFYHHVQINQQFQISAPQGELYYSSLRDNKHLIALAPSSAIVPFYSIAKDLIETNADFKLTIFYLVPFKTDLIYENQLNELVKQSNNKLKVIYCLTKQKLDGYINQRIDFNIIKQYVDDIDQVSFYLCGSTNFITHMKNLLIANNILNKNIRLEAGATYNKLYQDNANKQHKITIHYQQQVYEIIADGQKTILTNLLENRFNLNHLCMSGQCSMCRVRLIKGNVYLLKENIRYRQADFDNNIIFTCCSYLLSDIEILIM